MAVAAFGAVVLLVLMVVGGRTRRTSGGRYCYIGVMMPLIVQGRFSLLVVVRVSVVRLNKVL